MRASSHLQGPRDNAPNPGKRVSTSHLPAATETTSRAKAVRIFSSRPRDVFESSDTRPDVAPRVYQAPQAHRGDTVPATVVALARSWVEAEDLDGSVIPNPAA